MKRLKGSLSEYYAHEAHYFRYCIDNKGRPEGKRLGQIVWELMGKDGESWPELSECQDTSTVSRLVHKEFRHER